jgi:hypothetical protein
MIYPSERGSPIHRLMRAVALRRPYKVPNSRAFLTWLAEKMIKKIITFRPCLLLGYLRDERRLIRIPKFLR